MRYFCMRIIPSLFGLIALVVCAPDPSSDAMLLKIFSMNEQRFLEVEQLCVEFPGLRLIEVEDGEISTIIEPPASALDESKEAMVRRFIKDTSALAMRCHWIYSEGNKSLSSVSFAMYATGISVSGRLKFIKHVIGDVDDWVRARTRRGELRKLPRENWFIYEPN